MAYEHFFINLDREIIAWMNLARKVYLIFEVVTDHAGADEFCQNWSSVNSRNPTNQESTHAKSGCYN